MGARHALLVATSNYTDPGLRRLRSPVQEAHELRDLLSDPAIGGFDSAVMAVNESKAEIERRIEVLFRDRTSEDTVLLFISGHGIKNDHGELFFAACNTELHLPYSTAIPAVVVQRLIRESQAQSATVVLDCCYSGVFTNDIIARSSTSIDVEEQFGGGVYVMTATNEIEYAYEQEKLVLDKPVSGSAFTSALIDGLRTGAADTDRDGVITAEELYQFASRKVRAIGQQTPKNGGMGQGAIRIAKAARRKLSGEDGAKLLLGELIAPDAAAPGVPIGKAHEVDRHHGDLVHIDPFGHQGHLAVVGRFRSGKSTLLRTLVVGHAATHPASEVRFYCLDSDGALVGLQRWDNVAANAIDLAGVRAVLRDVDELIEQRKQLFHRYGIENIDTYRALRRKSADRLPRIDHADVFLVVDGWESLAEDVPDFTTSIRKIAERGLACGVHIILTARQWENIPRQVALLLQAHIELTLDEPATSRIDPELAATLPAVPGWALTGRRRFRVALPRMDDEQDPLVELIEVLEKPDVVPEAPQDPFFKTVEAAALWNSDDGVPRQAEDQYKVVFGVDEAGLPVELDIKETALGGMGPHGLCIGSTGSGKSEFLRTFVLGMMAAHDTTELNFVLIDFKGRATFQDFAAAPHVSAIISNLEDDGSLIDRIADALAGELNRRMEVLNKASAKNVRGYRQMAAAGDERCREPLPALVVVVDEFAELLSQQPDFIDLFVQIVRLGRSLGMHLLLASHRLEAGSLRGLDSHLSYRVGLKTFNATESRAAIGVPDAADLPASGGHGYLRHPNGMDRFRAAYASGPTDSGTSYLDEVLAGLRDQRPEAREIWLPPLDVPPTLDALLRETGTAGRLQVPVGLIDVPYHQRQEPMLVNLSGPAGHGAVVGGARSGKSTALRTMIAALALTHTPQEVQFYCLDFGGGGLFALRDLPHVGGVGGRRDRELVGRTVGELKALLDRREGWFQHHGVEGMTDYRNRKRDGAFPDDQHGDAFLVIDGWRTFREEFEHLEHDVLNLAANGLAYGIHVLITATRWAEIRPAMKDLLQTRIELRLGDPSESEIDRKSAVKVPQDRPGRGLHASKLHFLTALPRVDGAQLGARPNWESYTEDLPESLGALVEQVRSSWQGEPAPPVRLLPKLLPHDQLPRPEQQHREPKLVPIGINEDELAPVYLDFAAEPNFYAFGERESGKTSLLRTIVRGITERYTPKEALILLVDYRRTMLGFLETGHLLEYSVVESQLRSNVKDVTASLKKRLPAPDVTQEQLKNRSWWTGPELFVVVDDYDLVAPQGNNPLAPLAEFVPMAGDVGLHVVLARNSGGASRALYEPVIGKMRETSSPGLVMSADKEEGRLVADIKPRHLPPGRGTLASRRLRGPQLIQTAYFPSE